MSWTNQKNQKVVAGESLYIINQAAIGMELKGEELTIEKIDEILKIMKRRRRDIIDVYRGFLE